jgi:hypothetical protein
MTLTAGTMLGPYKILEPLVRDPGSDQGRLS